ncbi:MAG: amidohydrolase, partial [Candidatus Neomarinimicrobiota bacterium]|nr:amidohydrolase [Candidatus Neomarinimicrobiota bacterium]
MAVKIRPEVEVIADDIIAIRRDIHKYPELGFDENRTSGLVAEHMKDLGFDVETGIGKTGVIGNLKGNKSGPTIGLRADMDALPIQETGDVPYRSLHDGVMHACGHDGHTAMLLGAATVLKQFQEDLKGNIRFIFQPAEEGGGGARYMIEDGCLDTVDEIYGIHLWNYQKYGEVGIKEGPTMAAADEFAITIKGVGGHGATPQGT